MRLELPRKGRSTRTGCTCCNSLYVPEHADLERNVSCRAVNHHVKTFLTSSAASADRRPVDPPPIVELKIFEEGEGEPRDVTFAVNANYFLFATLEQARNVAQGRVAQDQTRLTVLTGTPVAGMVYLDRPAPAGYFIFPDLSVRHEGKYRLSFSLYEELKEAKDEDQNDNMTKPNGSGEAHVTHRLEVKSVPFTVYSAKKFPGLTESTSLSRMVAEQGCRVRIRRDVRMRRRDPKSGKDWESYDDDMAEARARMSQTPEATGYPALPPPHGFIDSAGRPRSSSNASHQSLAPSLPVSRRPSLQDVSQAYHQPTYGTAPHTPQNSYPQSSPYGPSPSMQFAPAPFMQQQAPMQPPPPQYQQQPFHQPASLTQAPPSQQSYYSYGSAPAPPQSQFTSAGAPYDSSDQSQRTSIDQTAQMSIDHRRQAIPHGPPPPLPPQSAFPPRSVQQAYQNEVTSQAPYQAPPLSAQPAYPSQHSHQTSYGSLDGYGSRHAPPEPVQPPPRPTLPLSSRPSFNDKLPPLNTTLGMLNNKHLEPSSPSPALPQGSYYPSGQTPSDSNKRVFGQVFSDRHMHQPLRQGARPDTPSHGLDYPGMYYASGDMDNEGPDQHNMKMEYRRADGRHIERGMPAHNYN